MAQLDLDRRHYEAVLSPSRGVAANVESSSSETPTALQSNAPPATVITTVQHIVDQVFATDELQMTCVAVVGRPPEIGTAETRQLCLDRLAVTVRETFSEQASEDKDPTSESTADSVRIAGGKLYIQVGAESQASPATALAEVLNQAPATAVPISVMRGIEVVPTSPRQTEIRYFFESDKITARTLSIALRASLGVAPKCAALLSLASRTRPTVLELWIASTAQISPTPPTSGLAGEGC